MHFWTEQNSLQHIPMKIFVNDKPLELLSLAELDSSQSFEHSYQNVDEIPEEVEWEGDVIFYEPSQDLVIRLLYLMRTRKMKRLDSVTLVTAAKKELKTFVKSRFLIVKAAGGLVTKKQKVRLEDHICTTWHTYTQNRRSILKKTYWYRMACTNDVGMKPQQEEGIDDIRWLSEIEAKTALIDSYPSMRYLFKKYLKNPKIA